MTREDILQVARDAGYDGFLEVYEDEQDIDYVGRNDNTWEAWCRGEDTDEFISDFEAILELARFLWPDLSGDHAFDQISYLWGLSKYNDDGIINFVSRDLGGKKTR